MAVTVKSIRLWRSEVDNRPGVLARALGPLATAGADLQVVMAYRYHADASKAAIEVYPVSTRKSVAAAQAAGLSVSSIPALLVQGDNQAGLGHATTVAIADAGINLGFLVVQVVGRKYSAIYGFESDADARTAAALVRKAAAKKTATKKR